MSRRFEGAITTPGEAQDSSGPPTPVRPPHPLGLDPAATEPGARAVIALIVALLAVLDAFVFVAIMRNRPLFDWRSHREHPAR